MSPDGPPVTFTEISQLSLCSLLNFKMMHLSVKGQAMFWRLDPHSLFNTDLKSAIVYVELEWAGGGTGEFYTLKCV